FERHAPPAAAMLGGLLAPGILDENPPHRFRGRGEEMAAIGKVRRDGTGALAGDVEEVRRLVERRGVGARPRLFWAARACGTVQRKRAGSVLWPLADRRDRWLRGCA